jgi:phage shock protein PspC (stress-responsive transcriptional regulator)
MRKTLNINLGGVALIIDENAFELLHNYLEALKRKFSNAAERDEIMADIEGRIAEMLIQKLADRKEVISFEDVQAVIDIMGKPEDIAGEEAAAEPATGAQASATSISGTTMEAPVKKRLFRDPDDAKIGGVISGLCHYFGIADPVWVRIIAVLLIFLGLGSIILVYLLMLVVVPKANTAAEKLQMKGEPVNINTIEKEIRDAAGKAGESVHKMVRDENFFERLWEILLAIFKVFAKVFAVFVIALSMILLVAVTICFFAFYILGNSAFNGASHLLVDNSTTLTLFSFGFVLFFATPFLAFIYAGLRTLLGTGTRVKWVKSVLAFCWVAGFVMLVITGIKIGNNFRQDGTVNNQNNLMQPAKGNLYVQLTDTTGKKVRKDDDDEGFSSMNIDEDGLFINGVNFNDMGLFPLGNPSLQIMPSENDSFYVQEVITSLGRNKNDAVHNAEMVIYSFGQADTNLNLNAHYYINKNSKWRDQEIKIRIAIPKGKTVRFADNIDMWHATVKNDNNYDDTYFANTVWTVEDGKVKCLEGENHKNSDEDTHPAKKVHERLNKIKNKANKYKNDHEKRDDDDDKDQDF